MGDYPLGGLVRQENDSGSVDIFGTVYGPGVLIPSAADVLHSAGMILARDNVGGVKLVPYVSAAVDKTGIPVGILGSNVQADGTPSDVDLNYIQKGEVRLEKLHTLAGGVGVAIVELDIDALQQAGMLPRSAFELQQFDNVQP